MIKPRKTVEIYDWYDIQGEICKRMGINEQDFRRYENVVGGKHKDFWHVCLGSIIPDKMTNDSICSMYSIEELYDEEGNVDPYYEETYGKWTIPMFKAYHSIMEEIDPNGNGIEVRFSW
jgi:hypothetical protein